MFSLFKKTSWDKSNHNISFGFHTGLTYFPFRNCGWFWWWKCSPAADSDLLVSCLAEKEGIGDCVGDDVVSDEEAAVVLCGSEVGFGVGDGLDSVPGRTAICVCFGEASSFHWPNLGRLEFSAGSNCSKVDEATTPGPGTKMGAEMNGVAPPTVGMLWWSCDVVCRVSPESSSGSVCDEEEICCSLGCCGCCCCCFFGVSPLLSAISHGP